MDDYLTVNRLLWDERGPVHAESADYGVEQFVADPAHLSDVVVGDPTIVRWTGPRHLASALAGFALTAAHLCWRAATPSTGYTTPRAEEP